MSIELTIKQDVDLSSFNTMGVSAKTSFFVEVCTIAELGEAIQFAEEKGLEILVLGGGSNTFFIKDFTGLVLHISILGKKFSSREDDILVKVAAGENWHAFVLKCVEMGIGGIENLSLIPGSVGAAPIQNIGAYGVELEDVFENLEAFMIDSKEIRTFNKSECKFGYRDSIFKKELKGKAIITSVTLKLFRNGEVNTSYKALSVLLESKGLSKPTIKDVSDAVIEIRQSKLPDPKEIGNTGSFFKNPVISVQQFDLLKSEFPELPSYPVTERLVKIPAGWLIDKAGWKGKRIGDAGVHSKQALVLVNHGKATGEEIWNLAEEIRLSIKEKFDIMLTPEVNVVG
ncbi:MAG TPA: UDP-N-acetylenolpyruvoylglucosamine reductase [Balneola sp.]|nr:UDP-N-acetylenolpyruvoylglucosamine reductase [Balneola sp.]MAO78403.1 UDP-N-acetylenolpyruvoylglucosamine reductase [Balneola sp.]MBF64403.1 UDP-N-acetylenolpyruvoylglucosamine reductase [Balneola sp.]HAH50836.1 UDP-N-acetylenolpyruvoylglucosamine reductase [Balneola sp.]HAW78841.1 UDP-N-acetylenolpyruvoylglucosamine reductase [Balneola sp.]|tara:strand:- start:15078 stop:16106 length:1029 start_codon:yes stop_codon:yes gene_type:complete